MLAVHTFEETHHKHAEARCSSNSRSSCDSKGRSQSPTLPWKPGSWLPLLTTTFWIVSQLASLTKHLEHQPGKWRSPPTKARVWLFQSTCHDIWEMVQKGARLPAKTVQRQKKRMTSSWAVVQLFWVWEVALALTSYQLTCLRINW